MNKRSLQKICAPGLIIAGIMIAIPTSAQEKLKPGQSFQDCADCPEMVVIPGGSFTIGSPETEPGRTSTEGPQKKISIKQFAAGKFDITRGQWAAFVKVTNRPDIGGCAWSFLKVKDTTIKPWSNNPEASWKNLGFQQEDDHPVVCISWTDAQDYVQWLSQKTGKKYRLLTEAEWEYAARAGTTTAYYWGNEISHEYANYGTDSTWGKGVAQGRDQWEYTSPVGAFPPNTFGLYDMSGNVLQYVEDCFSPSYAQVPGNGTAYKEDVELKGLTGRLSRMNGQRSCSSRIVRGSAFADPPFMLRPAFRNRAPGPGFTLETYRSGGVGFRVAREL